MRKSHIPVGNAPVVVREFRNATFFWLDNEVVDVYLPKIGSTPFAVYSYLCRFASNKTQECWPSMANMAERLQLSKSTVWRSLGILSTAGLIEITKGERGGDRHDPNNYKLLAVKSPSSASETRPSSDPSSRPSSDPSSATVPEQDLLTTLTNNPKEQEETNTSPSALSEPSVPQFASNSDSELTNDNNPPSSESEEFKLKAEVDEDRFPYPLARENVIKNAFHYFAEETGKPKAYELTKTRAEMASRRWNEVANSIGRKVGKDAVVKECETRFKNAVDAVLNNEYLRDNGHWDWDQMFKSQNRFQQRVDQFHNPPKKGKRDAVFS